MSALRNEQPEFSYTLLPENVHELTLRAPTLETLNSCFDQLDAIFASAPETRPILLLSDIRQSGTPPLTALMQHTQRLRSKYPQHQFVYDAVLHNMSGVMATTFIKVLHQLAILFGARVAFFRADQRDDAVAWLLEKSNPIAIR